MRRSRFAGIRTCGGRRGQALLVAVLLMTAILLVGILFVALVTYNQRQSARHEDMLAAQALAEAGVRYANHMLETEGADWRPPEPPAMDDTGAADPEIYGPDTIPGTEDDYYTEMELARGWCPVVTAAGDEYVRRGYSRFPDPRAPAGTSPVESLLMGRGYFLLRVSYDPWEPGDPTPPDPLDEHIKIESIGRVDGTQVYRSLVAYKPIPLLDYMRWVHSATEHGRKSYLGIPGIIDMNNGLNPPGNAEMDRLRTSFDGSIRVEGRLAVAGTPFDDGAGGMEPSTTFELHDEVTPAGYERRDTIEVTGGIEMHNDIYGSAQVSVVEAGGTTTDVLLPSDDPNFDTFGGRVKDGVRGTANGYSRFASRMSPPTLTLGSGTTNMDRYRRISRDSGDFVEYPVGSGQYVNDGAWGFGAGIYIDNSDDIQFDHDIGQLIDDWQRPSSASGARPADSGWNALFTTYAPPAVEIEFLPTEAAAGAAEANHNDVDQADEVWWPNHEAGQPGIKITRHDRTWRTPAGDDSGLRTVVMDYPTPWLDGTTDVVRYPVIVAEGNVRVSGQLPPAVVDASNALRRSYDMVIVSGGTIYIDGQILAPNDHLAAPVADEFNTKVALLARDCVCLNTTQIVPQLTTGTAPAVPDDPVNPSDLEKHWELAPGSDGRLYSSFYWGDDPEGTSAALVVRQAAGDPGPSGVAMTTWTEGAGAWQWYDFGDPPDPMVDPTFVLVPPGAVFPDGSTPPQPYGVEAVAPLWAPYREPAANLPWDMAGHLDPTPGVENWVVLRQADPHLTAGSTSYWAKKWKVAEYNADGLPVGAINARVNAAVYAERGCWYVLTSDHFDEEVTGDAAVEFRRYNYKITFNGAIAENFTASVEAARDWSDKCAYPAGYTGTTTDDIERWGTIEYDYDDTLRLARFHAPVADPTHPAANLPRMPLLPVSTDLVYYGEAQ